MSIIRSGFLVVVCVALGFAAGWRLKRPLIFLPAHLPGPHTASTLAVDGTSQPTETTFRNPSVSEIHDGVRLAAPSIGEHLAIIRWLKDSQLLPYVGFFNSNQVSPEFSKVFGLTLPETSQLNEASRQAKEQLEELARQHIQLDPASTDKKLIVTISAFPSEGGKVYNTLLAKISSVLGPDRYALFDELSGNALDNEFSGFGLVRNRYEVVLETMPSGNPIYKTTAAYVYDAINYRSYHGSVSGPSSGSSTNTTTNAADVVKAFPLLKPFTLPSVPSATPK